MSRTTRRAHRRHLRLIVRQRAAHARMIRSLKRGRSITTHLIAAGIEPQTAKGVSSSLAGVAKRLGIAPVKTVRTHHTVDGHSKRLKPVGHYTPAQVTLLMAAYSPRKAEYKAAKHLYAVAA